MIRILHTSDWHLGLETSGHDRLDEQELFLRWLVETCATLRIDALLVSGDVYDVVNPSVAAQSAFARFLVSARSRLPGLQIVVVAGNHDSGARLEIPRPFGTALGGIHLLGTFDPGAEGRHALRLYDSQGRQAAWCLAVPFLRATDLECRTRDGETPEEAFVRSLGSAYRDLQESCRLHDPTLPLISMGHLTISGSHRAGSERRLIGGVESVPVNLLAQGVDYVALGHIHRAQSWNGGNVRYCGAPYPIDFDERTSKQRVLVVELTRPGEPIQVEEIDVPRAVPMLRLPEVASGWEDVEAAIHGFDDGPWRSRPPALWPLVEVRYVADGPRTDLRERTEELFRGRELRLAGSPKPVVPTSRSSRPATAQSVDLKSREAPVEVLERHFRSRHGIELPSDLRACFDEALASVATGAAP